MFTDKIPDWTQELMDLLGPLLPPNTYLAGGTALTLHLNHRSSFDLDLYSPQEFNEQLILQRFEKDIPDFKVISSEWQTVIGGTKNTEVSLFVYQYPLLEPTILFKSIQIASLADLACMKLEAIGSRGLKRDFFDLYTICQLKEWTLARVIALTKKKYNRDESNVPHLLKSLVYFDDAETKPERAKIVDETWIKVKEFFTAQTSAVFEELVKQSS
ncbi:MAG: nucleotidyl transferase AbiEii/AbiGii toxin family protein [Candidatus Woesebacteria bacterium]